MTQYIDKAAVVAEIERRKQTWQHQDQQYVAGGKDVCDYLLGFLDTLEAKEENFIWNNARTTVPEDSTNQIICIKEDGLAVSTVGKIVNGTIKWAYLDDLLNINSFNVEVKEVDVDEAARQWEDKVYLEKGYQDEYGTPHAPFFEIGNAFREGARFILKTQKGE